MGLSRHCSPEMRSLILKLYGEGKSYRTIANLIGRSLGMVQNAIKYKAVPEKRGRPRKTTEAMDRKILIECKRDPFASSRVILNKVEANVSTRTIRRRLVEKGRRARAARRVPLLRSRHRKNRITFAKLHIEWVGKEGIKKWRNILFSDESKFMLFGNDGKTTVRRPINEAFNPAYTKKTIKFGGGKILVWACFSWYGVGPIHLIDGIMTKEDYINILEDTMLPFAEWNMPLKWVFQHDNDPKHSARATTSWLQRNNITVLYWPAQSPDLNPIENLWKIVKDKLQEVKPTNKHELWVAVQQAWYSISNETCRNLVDSMPKRCRAVLEKKGWNTKY